jgi:hypothetical protein
MKKSSTGIYQLSLEFNAFIAYCFAKSSKFINIEKRQVLSNGLLP